MKFQVFMFIMPLFILMNKSYSKPPYGMAGCGLGSIILEGQEGKAQIVAVTLNTLGGQSTAISMGSSNCENSPDKKAYFFIKTNHVALQRELSQGSGESLRSLAHIYNCTNIYEFESTLSVNYKNIYTESQLSKEQISHKLLHVIKSNKNHLSSCKSII